MNVIAHVQDGVGVITLNRPQVLNVLDLGMVRDLSFHLNAWATDSNIRAVILRGEGNRAFCAGGDVRTIYFQKKSGSLDAARFFDEEYALDLLVHRYPKPTIALMNGVVMGGGMGLAQGCTHRLVTECTQIAMPETAIGLFPDVGSTYFLSQLPTPMARYIGMIGDTLSGADAVNVGLADRMVPSEFLSDLPAIITSFDSQNWLNGKEMDEANHSFFSAYVFSAIERHFEFDSVEGIHASLYQAQSSEQCPWVERTFARLRKNSPLMVHVTFKQFQKGVGLPLEKCFKMERAMMMHAFKDGDAIEGIRALLVDKDLTPKWRHSDLLQVEDSEVDAFFDFASI